MKLEVSTRPLNVISASLKSSYTIKVDNGIGTEFQTSITNYDTIETCLDASEPKNYAFIADKIKQIWRQNCKSGLDQLMITNNSRVTLYQGDEDQGIPDKEYDFRLIVDKGRINSKYVDYTLMLNGSKVLEFREPKGKQ